MESRKLLTCSTSAMLCHTLTRISHPMPSRSIDTSDPSQLVPRLHRGQKLEFAISASQGLKHISNTQRSCLHLQLPLTPCPESRKTLLALGDIYKVINVI